MSFSFRNSDYKNRLLGAYDFAFMPISIPERHADSIELLATTEHEQIHDMLARQTTHGFAILFVNVYLEKEGQSINNEQEIVQLATKALENARAVHERYATFGTLCTNRIYENLITKLPDDYQTYLQEAVQLMPQELIGTRLARIFVYASILVALTPEINTPPKEVSKTDLLLGFLKKVANSESRWQKIVLWKANQENNLAQEIIEKAQDLGYTDEELDLAIYFEDTIQYFENDKEGFQLFLTKERVLVEALKLYISSQTQAKNEQALSQKKMEQLLVIYRDILIPSFRLFPTLVEEIKMDKNTFGNLHRLFQDKPLAGIPAITIVKNLGRNAEVVYRMIAGLLERLTNFNCIGFIESKLDKDLFGKFQSHINLSSSACIQWSFIYNEISLYQKEKLETLYLFHLREFIEKLSPVISEKLLIITTPYDSIDLEYQKTIELLLEKGCSVYGIQPFNFLNFLEWRINKKLAIENIFIYIMDIPDELYSFIQIRFEDEPIPYIHLCTQSTVIAYYQLEQLKLLNIQLVQVQSAPSEKERGLINFLKIYWRNGWV